MIKLQSIESNNTIRIPSFRLQGVKVSPPQRFLVLCFLFLFFFLSFVVVAAVRAISELIFCIQNCDNIKIHKGCPYLSHIFGVVAVVLFSFLFVCFFLLLHFQTREADFFSVTERTTLSLFFFFYCCSLFYFIFAFSFFFFFFTFIQISKGAEPWYQTTLVWWTCQRDYHYSTHSAAHRKENML